MNEQDEFFARRHALREAAAATGARVYIAGPMTGYVAYNWPAFYRARQEWAAAGWDARTPCEANDAVWQRHHSRDFDPYTDKCDYGDPILAEIYAEDQKLLSTCSAIALLPGWEKSRGANHELATARLLGMTVYDAATMQPLPTGNVSPGEKPSNPKDMIGSSKLPLHLWPETASMMGCLALLDGALKYGRSNFRAIGVRSSIYYDAARRHLNKWFEGEEHDPDSGLPHLSHALACIAIIVDAQAAGKLNDDRMYPGGYTALAAELTPHVTRLKTLYADKSPKHYTCADASA